jgi:predicted ATP-binding protein involved in virulence
MPLLTSIKVQNLLGRFNHRVEFDRSWAFVIVHGPNGVGKTKLLELVKALSTDNIPGLLSIPFESLTLGYDDGTTLSAVYPLGGEPPDPAKEHEVGSIPNLSVTLSRPNQPPATFILDRGKEATQPTDIRRRAVEQELPVERLGPDMWFDYDQGDHISFAALRERYATHLLAPIIADLADSQEAYAVYQEFIDEIPTHLIETQRLLGAPPKRGRMRDAPPVQMTVTKYAKDLSERLKRALAENSTTSQRLDRTFPERVLNAPEPDVTDQQVRERYEEQQSLRDRLAEVALLEESATLPLPERELESWELRVLQTYLEDADEKLATFKPVLDRVELLREIVNSHFLFKRLIIDQVSGFKFVTDQDRELGPGALSSGEQHELVLAYDLLFNVDPGSLVLVDEPEISLHVSWQQQFLNDLQMMAELQSLRFVIATHSPQVIDKWWDRTEALYEDPEDGEGDGP